MHTEDEARTKWCPFARVPVVVATPDQSCPAASGNRATTMDDECNCIASDCMAWRRGKDAWLTSGGKVIQQADCEPECGYGHWVKQGYCGLAGKDGA